MTNKSVQNLGTCISIYMHTHTELVQLFTYIYGKSLPSVNQEQEKKSKGDISDVAEDVVEGADKPPGVGTVEVIVADVQIPRHIQYLPQRINLQASTNTCI